MGTTREALEAALAAEPESVALHSAYADLLIEEGDPRGEYIRLELALEDLYLSDRDRRLIKKQSDRLLKKYESLWLGSFQQYLQNEIYSQLFSVHWKRGWIESIFFPSISTLDINAIQHCEAIRLLRSISLRQALPAKHHPDRTATSFESIVLVLKELPLHRFALGNIICGDSAVEILVKQRFYSELTHLSLNHCSMTDDGAIVLANTPHTRNLKTLEINDNYLSPIGIAALAEIGFEIGQQLDNPAWDWGADAV